MDEGTKEPEVVERPAWLRAFSEDIREVVKAMARSTVAEDVFGMSERLKGVEQKIERLERAVLANAVKEQGGVGYTTPVEIGPEHRPVFIGEGGEIKIRGLDDHISVFGSDGAHLGYVSIETWSEFSKWRSKR